MSRPLRPGTVAARVVEMLREVGPLYASEFVSRLGAAEARQVRSVLWHLHKDGHVERATDYLMAPR